MMAIHCWSISLPLQGTTEFSGGEEMRDMDENWFQEIRYTNSQLRRKGIKLRPKSPRQTNPPARPNESDAKFLKGCGVAWEPELASQLSLDFSGYEDTE